jgi:hypothetical protein
MHNTGHPTIAVRVTTQTRVACPQIAATAGATKRTAHALGIDSRYREARLISIAITKPINPKVRASVDKKAPSGPPANAKAAQPLARAAIDKISSPADSCNDLFIVKF